MEMSQEYIDKIQEDIPEWKRGAVTITDAEATEEKKGLLGRLKRKVKSKLSETEMAKQFKDSEEYKKIE